MGKKLRHSLLWLCAAVCAAFIAVLFNPFYEALLKRNGIDSALWVEPMLELFTAHWFQVLVSGLFGLTAGALAHFAATCFDRENSRTMPVKPAITDSEASRLRAIASPEYMKKVEAFDREQKASALECQADAISGTIKNIENSIEELPIKARKPADEDIQSMWTTPYDIAKGQITTLQGLLKKNGFDSDLSKAPFYDENNAIPAPNEKGITDPVKLHAYRRIYERLVNAKKLGYRAEKNLRDMAIDLRSEK